MAKELLKGQIAGLPIGYEIKVEDAALKVSAVADLAGLVDLGEKALPPNSLLPVEIMILEMVKQGLKVL